MSCAVASPRKSLRPARFAAPSSSPRASKALLWIASSNRKGIAWSSRHGHPGTRRAGMTRGTRLGRGPSARPARRAMPLQSRFVLLPPLQNVGIWFRVANGSAPLSPGATSLGTTVGTECARPRRSPEINAVVPRRRRASSGRNEAKTARRRRSGHITCPGKWTVNHIRKSRKQNAATPVGCRPPRGRAAPASVDPGYQYRVSGSVQVQAGRHDT